MMTTADRRIACLVLPALPCEIIAAREFVTRHIPLQRNRPKQKAKPAVSAVPALGIVITEQERPLTDTDTLDAVTDKARSFGVVVGQSIADARTRMGSLQVRALTQAQLQAALGQVAEAVMQFGVTVSLHAPDTVCLDITGIAQLFGGEEALMLQVAARVRSMGHRVKVAVANGPLLAQALARWGNYSAQDNGIKCYCGAQMLRALAALPIVALPFSSEPGMHPLDGSAHTHDDLVVWLMRCGLYSVGDLQQLPVANLAARLGENANQVLQFVQGRDDTPLLPHQPAVIPSEQFDAEEGMRGAEPLLFVLKGLAARLSARLQGRGQATAELRLVLQFDRSIAALNGIEPEMSSVFEFPNAIYREEELERIVAARIKRLRFESPVVSMTLQATAVTAAEAAQLDLSRAASGFGGNYNEGPEVIPTLLAEITADIGLGRAGVLSLVPSHRPECKSVLVPLTAQKSAPLQKSKKKRAQESVLVSPQRDFTEFLTDRKLAVTPKQEATAEEEGGQNSVICEQPSRLFTTPLPVPIKFEPGATWVMGSTLFTVGEVQFERRLAQVEWWSGTAISRDYWRLWLESPRGGCDALAFTDRTTGHRYIQALYD
jgi:protein ImuB